MRVRHLTNPSLLVPFFRDPSLPVDSQAHPEQSTAAISDPARMLIALIGTPSSGKNTIAQYLISQHGFRRIGLARTGEDGAGSPEDMSTIDSSEVSSYCGAAKERELNLHAA